MLRRCALESEDSPVTLQSVEVTAKVSHDGGTIVVIVTAVLVILAGWYLRHRRRFWLVCACCVVANLVSLNLFPQHVKLERFLGILYFPIDWVYYKFGYGIHDFATIFLLLFVLPFLYSLLIEAVFMLIRSIRVHKHP